MKASPPQQTQASRQTTLITGASSGIGAAMARLFASKGYGLALVARTELALQALADELRAAHGISVTVVPQDLAQPGAAQAIFAEIQRANITVDVLVNNAGYASYGPFAEADLGNELDEMRVIDRRPAALGRGRLRDFPRAGSLGESRGRGERRDADGGEQNLRKRRHGNANSAQW